MGGSVAGIGEALRSTRERRGLSIDDVARDTRISPRFLEALEAEQFDELPAPVYVRGFLRSYASYLKIEAQPLLDDLVGGDVTAPTAAGGYVGRQPRSDAGSTLPRRNDPFQRRGVVSAPPLPMRPNLPRAEPEAGSDADDSWSPEPLAPFTEPHQDHGYVPGSDLMESPEYAYAQEELDYEPRYRRGGAGILSERPPRPNDPGVSRSVALFAGGLLALLAFLGVAVVMTGDGGGDDQDKALASGGLTPGITPGSIIPVGTRTTTPEASASAGAAVDASGTPSATTTTEPTPETGTPTPTATSGQAPTTAPTAAPTATATPVPATPTPQPTPVRVPPHPSTYSACNTALESNKCGSAVVRVICFPPFPEPGKNDNYFVDTTGQYPLQPGWREIFVNAPTSIGPVIEAGRDGCI
jgi:cytoskeleton protein RodZ